MTGTKLAWNRIVAGSDKRYGLPIERRNTLQTAIIPLPLLEHLGQATSFSTMCEITCKPGDYLCRGSPVASASGIGDRQHSDAMIGEYL